MKKIVERFGDKIKILNDNGSENMKDAEAYLASLNITQYWRDPIPLRTSRLLSDSSAHSRENAWTTTTNP
ncbi:MAG: hypothetical protein Ta2A_12950 [Treponemataceae bacterium]|nr:MAG: hypothetical protein Ta2A_12950 [Treponemataceae bacterium]